MAESSIVAIVFRDLVDAYDELSSGSKSPKAVRQSFANFVNLSQKLTSHMRKEYRAKRGEPWVAADFDGWNDISELFKQLRNDDEHDRPVGILVHETLYYRPFENAPPIAAAGTWSFSLEDQLADNSREDLRIVLPDPETGQPSDREILPEGREYEFHLSPSSKRAQELLEKIGDPNVRTLGEKCFRVLTDYYRYYQDQLATPKGSV